MEGSRAAPVLLVGSLPFGTTEDALRTCGTTLGELVGSLPDGEVGERKMWINYLPEQVYSAHPDLEETRRPDFEEFQAPEHEDPDRPPGMDDPATWWHFRIKPGVEDFRLDPGYDRFAKESYAVFKRLKAEGTIAPGVAFQVCFPATMSAIDAYFEDPAQWPAAHAAYRDGIHREVRSILETVPPDELVVQLDVCEEVVDLALGDVKYQDYRPDRTYADKLAAHTEWVAELANGIPDSVRLGLHLCYGTWGGWPMIAMKDLTLCVELANSLVAAIDRKVDYIHMPVARTTSDEFFAPLDELDVGGARIYLGLVHPQDRLPGFTERVEAARRHLDDFGIGAVCGFGREDPAELGDIIGLHRECAEALDGSASAVDGEGT